MKHQTEIVIVKSQRRVRVIIQELAMFRRSVSVETGRLWRKIRDS